MDDKLKGFVAVKDVAERYQTSRSTVDRRRLKAQRNNDADVLRRFRLRTRDGEVHDAPSREQVQQFIKDGLVPEWFVSRGWLRKEYGERKTGESETKQPGVPSSEPSSATGNSVSPETIRQYEERIGDLKDQLNREREEKQQLLEYAQKDKQLFGHAVSNLTKVLTLPGVADAIDTANRQLVEGSSDENPQSAERGESKTSESDVAVEPEPKNDGGNSGPGIKTDAASNSKRKWFRWKR